MVENIIWENQQEYYKAIEKSTENNDAGIFAEFMIGLILQTIRHSIENDTVNQLLRFIDENPTISYEGLAAKTGKSRATISRMISSLKNKGIICREGSAKNGKWVIKKPNSI